MLVLRVRIDFTCVLPAQESRSGICLVWSSSKDWLVDSGVLKIGRQNAFSFLAIARLVDRATEHLVPADYVGVLPLLMGPL